MSHVKRGSYRKRTIKGYSSGKAKKKVYVKSHWRKARRKG